MANILSTPSRPPRNMPNAWAPIVFGVALGTYAALDGFAAHNWLTWSLIGDWHREWPFALSGILAVSLVLFLVFSVNGKKIWRRRVTATMALIMLASHLIAVKAGPLNPLVLALPVAATIWLFERADAPTAAWRPSVFLMLSLGFMACILLSCLARSPSDVFEGTVTFVPKLLIALLVAELATAPGEAWRATLAMVWACGIMAVVGLGQEALFVLTHEIYSLADPQYLFAQTPLGPVLRAAGFSLTANQYAPPIAAAAIIVTYQLGAEAGRRHRKLLLLGAFLMAAAVTMSVVRGSWIAMMVALVAIPFIAKPQYAFHWIGAAALAGVLLTASGVGILLIHMINGISEAGTSERYDLLMKGIEVMLTHPTGAGVYDFGRFSPTFERHPVHNAIMQAGSELGFPGMLVFLAIAGWIAYRLIRALRTTRDPVMRGQIGAVLAGYITIFMASQSEPMGYSQALWIYFALGEAVAGAALTPATIRTDDHE